MRVGLVLLLSLSACGSSPIIGGGDDVAFMPDSGPDSTIPEPDAGDAGDAGDAASDAPIFQGGPFLCDQCVCDGTMNMCFHSGGGPAPAPFSDAGDFGDASACPTDGGPTSCQPIPIDCLLAPSCACIEKYRPPPACTCALDPSGEGFRVDCVYP